MNEAEFNSNLSEIYHSLSASRRCHVIRILAASDKDQLSVRTLSRQIAAIEEDTAPKYATGEPYRNVYNALSQTHLDTLSEVDIIIYDSERQNVKRGPHFTVASLLILLSEATYRALTETSTPIFDDSTDPSTTD